MLKDFKRSSNYFFRIQNCFWDVLIKICKYKFFCLQCVYRVRITKSKQTLSIYHFLKEMFYDSQKYLKYSSNFLLVWYKSQVTSKQEDVELSIFFLCSHPQRQNHCFDQNVSHCQLSILVTPFLLLSCFHFLVYDQPNFLSCLIVPEVEINSNCDLKQDSQL